jgi:hypothetical protein
MVNLPNGFVRVLVAACCAYLSLVGCGSSVPRRAWCQVQAPSPGPVGGSLQSVGAGSASFLLAVGSYQPTLGTGPHTLSERWDGSRWSIVPTEHVPSSSEEQLESVSVIDPSHAWAVGTRWFQPTDGSKQTQGAPLVERWDGARWTVVSAPMFDGGELRGVLALADDDVWAVGLLDQATNDMALAMHWDGRRWKTFRTPGAAWEAVGGASGEDVWAVGSREGSSGSAASAHWDGSRWTLVRGDPATLPEAHLQAVTDDVWAVGQMQGITAGQQAIPLVEHWNGRAWRTASTPLQPFNGASYAMFTGVAAASPSDVWAVGAAISPYKAWDRPAETWVPITEHWDGKEWAVVPGVLPAQSTTVTAVANVPGTGSFWAVGEPEGHIFGPFVQRTC